MAFAVCEPETATAESVTAPSVGPLQVAVPLVASPALLMEMWSGSGLVQDGYTFAMLAGMAQPSVPAAAITPRKDPKLCSLAGAFAEELTVDAAGSIERKGTVVQVEPGPAPHPASERQRSKGNKPDLMREIVADDTATSDGQRRLSSSSTARCMAFTGAGLPVQIWNWRAPW